MSIRVLGDNPVLVSVFFRLGYKYSDNGEFCSTMYSREQSLQQLHTIYRMQCVRSFIVWYSASCNDAEHACDEAPPTDQTTIIIISVITGR